MKRITTKIQVPVALAVLLSGAMACSQGPRNQSDTVKSVDSAGRQTTQNQPASSMDTTDSTSASSPQKMNVTPPTHDFEVTVKEVRDALENHESVFLLDVRTQGEYDDAHIAQADALIPYQDVLRHLDELPADKEAYIYVYCRSGNRSGHATRELREAGYKHAYNVRGGINTWVGAGLPVVR